MVSTPRRYIIYVVLVLSGIVIGFFLFHDANKVDKQTGENLNSSSSTTVITSLETEQEIEDIQVSKEECEPSVLKTPPAPASDPIKSLISLGEFHLGCPATLKPGNKLLHGYKRIPPSRFYVEIWHKDIHFRCILDECGPAGETVASLRGWLQGYGMEDSGYGLPWPNFSEIKSLVLISDRDLKIVGIYPNVGINNLEAILRQHPGSADFDMLKGIDRLGNIKVGLPLPIDPKDYIRAAFAEDIKHPKFYVYLIHETVREFPWCPFYECGANIDYVYHLGGWFTDFDHNSREVVEKFGLNVSQVARGELTLVVVADQNARIISIHPDKDMRDLRMILRQHGFGFE